ncbi:MAG: Unknown protein, partial [uncultured Sulfurovum sp.]
LGILKMNLEGVIAQLTKKYNR